MIERTGTYFLGYRILIDHGVALKPRWWQIFKRLGWAGPEYTFTTPLGSVILSKENRFMTVRSTDYQDLLSSPDFPRPEPRDTVTELSEAAQRMGIDTIRNAQ